ncbi:hypothetical protein FIBSPDRAFT_928980 [Athelia psychrophila]|uniref:Uncharacterized protein n=1 Tax=Athelia psychrophila TaxID=1759441 RepID=A0A166PG29_9AGAM|nr:hypothetical protein FIBSPDRAFT_928980 [Fibularhizoctonia sp. CBS 109695]
MLRRFKQDSYDARRAVIQPAPSTPSSPSCTSCLMTPKLEMDRIDTSSFSESFSPWMHEARPRHSPLTPAIMPSSGIDAHPISIADMSYDVKEIMVLSKKHKKKTSKSNCISESSHRDSTLGFKGLDLDHIRLVGTGLRLGTIEGDNRDSLDPRLSYMSADISDRMELHDSLEMQIREQVAQNRASFWDNLTDDESTSPATGTFLELEPVLRLPFPRRLQVRKRKSFASRLVSGISASAINQKDRIKRKFRRHVQVVNSPASTTSLESSSSRNVSLPCGTVQAGSGIGFTYNSRSTAISEASISTTAPRTCHGLFSAMSLPSMHRKRRTRERSSPDLDVTEEDREMHAVMREIYGSRWSLEMSALGYSPPFDTYSCTPSSPTLDTPFLSPEAAEFLNVKEAVAGDPDATLRLLAKFRLSLEHAITLAHDAFYSYSLPSALRHISHKTEVIEEERRTQGVDSSEGEKKASVDSVKSHTCKLDIGSGVVMDTRGTCVHSSAVAIEGRLFVNVPAIESFQPRLKIRRGLERIEVWRHIRSHEIPNTILETRLHRAQLGE